MYANRFYPNTLCAFATVLRDTPKIMDPEGKPTEEHLAWMTRQVLQFDRSSLDDAAKAAYWIGWMLLGAEVNGFWNNEQSQALIRRDVQEGNHLPKVDLTA